MKSKKFILECVEYSKRKPDLWNPYYVMYDVFGDELKNMSNKELNNLLKLGVSCLSATRYTEYFEEKVNESKEGHNYV